MSGEEFARQKLEFITLAAVAKAHAELPPVVDDDYPAARHSYEGALRTFIAALRANGRMGLSSPDPRTRDAAIAVRIEPEVTAAFGDVAAELQRARAKFPAFNSGHEGWAIIREELDELWAEVRSNQSTPGRNERMAKEAIQVAAMAVRFLIDMQGFKN